MEFQNTASVSTRFNRCIANNDIANNGGRLLMSLHFADFQGFVNGVKRNSNDGFE